MPPEARVRANPAKYAFLGIIPLVIPSVLIDIPIPTDRIPVQQGNDLAYIRSLADEVGYVFYLEPGRCRARASRIGGRRSKSACRSRRSTSTWTRRPTSRALVQLQFARQECCRSSYIQNQQTKSPIPIPIPDITPLNPPLGLIPPIPLNIEPIDEPANYSPIRAAVHRPREGGASPRTRSRHGQL